MVNNPRPSPFTCCTNKTCASYNLGPVLLCGGKGEDPQNCGRWYQICRECKKFLWHNPKTSLDEVPEDILVRHVAKKSLVGLPSTYHLDCPRPHCRGKNNQPRPANRACGKFPQLCKPCCILEGGCTLHRVSASNEHVPVSDSETVNSGASIDFAPTPNSSSDTPPIATSPPKPAPPATPASTMAPTGASTSSSKSYARPLKPGFGQAYTVVHRKKWASNQKTEEDQKIADNMSRLVIVILWLKANTKPARLSVIARHAGNLVLAEHPEITQKLEGITLVSIFKALPRPEWIEQDHNVPIAMPRQSRILCRLPTLDDMDCLELDEELDILGLAGRHAVTAMPIPHRRSLSVTSLQEDGSPAQLTGPSAKRPRPAPMRLKLPFPRTYAIEMVTGFRIIQALVASGRALAESFELAFTSSDYVYKTVNKHQKIYERASDAGIINQYANFGHTPEGKWRNVVHKVADMITSDNNPSSDLVLGPSDRHPVPQTRNDVRRDVTPDVPQRSSSPTEELTDDGTSEALGVPALATADYEAFLADTVIYEMSIQEFNRNKGPLVTEYTSDMEHLNLYTTRIPAFTGSTKRVFLGYVHKQGMHAIKHIALPDDWWTPLWSSEETAIWAEASRVALCGMDSISFHQLVRNANTKIYPFEVLATSLFVVKGQFQIGQEWVEGPSKPLSMSDLKLWQQTMDAFSHYTYQLSGGEVIHLDFQYYSVERPVHASIKGKAVEGATEQVIKVFDCTTHLPDSSTLGIGPFLRSKGYIGLYHLAEHHVCNHICSSLGLNVI